MKRKILIGFILIVLLVGVALTSRVFSDNGNPTLAFNPNNTNLDVGEEIEITISANKIGGAAFTLDYDSSKLELIKPITVFSNWNKMEIENTYFLNTTTYEAVESQENICKIKFKAIQGTDSTVVSFSNIQLTKADASIENKSSQNINVKISDVDELYASVNYSTQELTNGSVTASIVANKEIQEVDGWTRSLDRKSLTKEYANNIEETVTVKDLSDNEKTVNIRIANIDKLAPTLSVTYSTQEPTTQNVVATIIANEEIQDLSGWLKTGDGNKLTKEYSRNISETVVVKDMAGNEKSVEISISNIDKSSLDTTPPTINVSYSTNEPTSGSVIVTLTADEEIQDVTGWTKSTDGKVLVKTYSNNKVENVTIKDLAGNETTAIITVNNIFSGTSSDTTPPTISVTYSTDGPTNGNVQVTIEANEEIQDVEGWTKSSDGRKLTKEYSDNTNETVTVKDQKGNATNVTIEINNIDKTIPVISANMSTEELTNGNVVVTIESNEEVQDAEGWTKSSDGKKLRKEYSNNISETITVKDLAGNEVEIEIEISNIDKTAPDVNVVYSTEEPTNESVIVTLNTNEEVQDVAGWTKSANGKSLSKEYTVNKTDSVTIKDLAGNERTISFTIDNIDKTIVSDVTPPIINVTYSTDKLTSRPVEVTIEANEEIKKLDGWSISADGKKLTKEYTGNVNETITVEDLSGNKRTVNINISNILENNPNDVNDTIDNSIDNAINNTTNNTVNDIVNNSINNVIDNKTNTTTEETNTKVDNTTSSEILPYTGPKAKCIIVIGLISIIGIVLYVKFKKDYEGV